MTDFCPKCGKKAEDGEKVCPICGEEMTSISQENDNNKKVQNAHSWGTCIS